MRVCMYSVREYELSIPPLALFVNTKIRRTGRLVAIGDDLSVAEIWAVY